MSHSVNQSWQGQQLQNHSFRGQNLAGVSFRAADIRGADFRQARLVGADFSQARCGLSRRSMVIFAAGILGMTLISSLLIGAAAGLPIFVLFDLFDEIALGWQIAVAIVFALMSALLYVLLIYKGIGSAATSIALFAALVVLAVAIPNDGVALIGIGLILLAGFSGLLAGIVLQSILLTALGNIAKWGWMIPLVLMAGAATLSAVWETIAKNGESPDGSVVTALKLAVIGAAVLTPYVVGVYLSRRALAGIPRFRLISSVAIMFLSHIGTSFRGADLTDASFIQADMAAADLREAILLRTDWQGALHLEQARVEGGYLSDPLLRRLVSTKDGCGQNFDQMNLEGLNLQNAHLAGASFLGSTLSRATLRQADLSGAKLVHAQLYDTDMGESCLTGAFIEHWGISTNTIFDGVRCDYVYMHLPTTTNPDPMRKPDDNQEFFAEGDFTDFISPIIRTLEYYHQQYTDPRGMASAAKTLDLIQRDAINPAVSALAVQQLAQRHPDAQMEIVSLKAKDGEKLQIRSLVSDEANRAKMSEEFHQIYRAMSVLPPTDLERLTRNIVHKDENVRQLEAMLMAAVSHESFYAETHIRPHRTVTCLLFSAAPVDEAPLRLDVEFREIRAKLRASHYRDVFDLIPVLAARPDDLLQALNEHKPRIVQFSGHGSQRGELLLLDNDGYAQPVTADALTTLFIAMKDEVCLVILNACYSEIQAQAINQVIDCVIGMDSQISDHAATIFIASFYRALGFGRSIRNAFDQGIASLGMDSSREQSIPKLLVRPGIDANQILFAAPDILAPWRV